MKEKKNKNLAEQIRDGVLGDEIKKDFFPNYKLCRDKNGFVKYSNQVCQVIPSLFEQGESQESACIKLGITMQTKRNWCKSYPAFNQAWTEGVLRKISWWKSTAKNNMFIDKNSDYRIDPKMFELALHLHVLPRSTKKKEDSSKAKLLSDISDKIKELNRLNEKEV